MTALPRLHRRTAAKERLRIVIRGAVQGVGFRPFVYRLARSLDISGWVSNSSQGVLIDAEGDPGRLRSFLIRLEAERPAISSIQSMESSFLDAMGHEGFEIKGSSAAGDKTAVILPDIATCGECLAEISDPTNRRYLYPFTNCTNCGPRYSIIERLPYDRPNTTMRGFVMCSDCKREYDDPENRRFHAQPNACPKCGPQLQLWNRDGRATAYEHSALLAAVAAIRSGKIVAVKGLGGFHLMADAANELAVFELRKRKRREQKPLALMMPSLAAVEDICVLSDLERRSLTAPERPIVILKARSLHTGVCGQVAPGNPYFGCMLPYTPLHYLLLRQLRFPVVATSGNLSDETICIDESEALERLRGIADMFLVHDRPITRHVDDSIVRVVAGREMVVRRARGFAPLPLDMDEEVGSILAVGAHQKNSIAASSGKQIFMSQHIGDLDTPQSSTAFKGVISSLEELYEISPDVVACDLHPDYLSTRYACDTALPRVKVQHHYAHILACMAENHLLDAPVLGVAWDGTGFGDDGTIWGGEFLSITGESYTREAHFRTFPLPGGDKAAREPRRTALGVLYELSGDTALAAVLPTLRAFQPRELVVMRRMLTNQLNCPRTSSVGRLFDAVASVAGIRQMAGYEGQAAMELEFAVGSLRTDESYDFEVIEQLGGPAIIDWGRAVSELIDDVVGGVHRRIVAARFHNMLVETIVVTAKDSGIANVALSGGCFQNKYLLERTVTRLKSEGFRPYWHQRVPPNDGGIALGQTIAAIRAQAAAKKERKGEWQNVFSCTR